MEGSMEGKCNKWEAWGNVIPLFLEGVKSKGGRILLVVALCSVDVYVGTIILLLFGWGAPKSTI